MAPSTSVVARGPLKGPRDVRTLEALCSTPITLDGTSRMSRVERLTCGSVVAGGCNASGYPAEGGRELHAVSVLTFLADCFRLTGADSFVIWLSNGLCNGELVPAMFCT